jgi:hypothetical protein
LLVVDVNNTDYVRNPEDLHEVIKRIDADLHGLFSDPNYKRASMFTTPEIL